MTKTLIYAAAILILGSAAPASAQMNGMMKSDGGMKMSKMEMKKMASCNKMSHAMMMKSSRCKMMMKKHPDMMNHK